VLLKKLISSGDDVRSIFKILSSLFAVLLLTSCGNTKELTNVDITQDNKDKDDEVIVEIASEEVLERFKIFTNSSLDNFELEINIDSVELDYETTIEAKMKVYDMQNVYIKMTTLLSNMEFEVELYNTLEEDETPVIFMRMNYANVDWLKTKNLAKSNGYEADQFNDLILVDNGEYTYIKKTFFKDDEYHLIHVDMNKHFIADLAEATNSNVEDVDLGKMVSDFYVDDNGIPHHIISEYVTTNSNTNVEIKLTNVNAVTKIIVPDTVIEQAIDYDTLNN